MVTTNNSGEGGCPCHIPLRYRMVIVRSPLIIPRVEVVASRLAIQSVHFLLNPLQLRISSKNSQDIVSKASTTSILSGRGEIFFYSKVLTKA
jgi:hypothetical protein